jgi:hypothetical protein
VVNFFLMIPVCKFLILSSVNFAYLLEISLAEPHHFYAALALSPGKNFDAAPAPHHCLKYRTAIKKERKIVPGGQKSRPTAQGSYR